MCVFQINKGYYVDENNVLNEVIKYLSLVNIIKS